MPGIRHPEIIHCTGLVFKREYIHPDWQLGKLNRFYRLRVLASDSGLGKTVASQGDETHSRLSVPL